MFNGKIKIGDFDFPIKHKYMITVRFTDPLGVSESYTCNKHS